MSNKLQEKINFVVNLFLNLVRDRDGQITQLKTDLERVSADAAELRKALENAETDKAAALAAQLDDFTTQLEAQIKNPTPASDMFNQAVVDSPLFPEIVETPVETDSATVTPVDATVANVEAVRESIAADLPT